MKEILRKWWRGTDVAIETDKYGNLPPGVELFNRHWTAKLARVARDFWLQHWQWCFYATFSIVGLTIAAMKL